ncbi:putative UDP-glucose 6-dehydrogenase [Rosa chinensis]|uniref:Putative UDP-glucose 6-dehydrogenase n=1 Tax=Rosa chinensis TaxID=74649 RepID=A0A2P6Q254_ROSCH|nr:UDP-glucose 6-dehydrogenase 1 [Rosa chinensis]PRQ28278.1 putative UDP-glucose 6-dehydrogenase [Rosa chinensis]
MADQGPLNVVPLAVILPDPNLDVVPLAVILPGQNILPPNNVLPPDFDHITNVCCIGATQSSVMHMAVIAERYPRLNVVVADFNQQLIEDWNEGNIDFEEEGMFELLENLAVANLQFVDDVNEAIVDAQMIFIGVEIPIKVIGCREGFDLRLWVKAIRRIVKVAPTSKIIVERSTMPIDSFDMTTTLLARRPPPPYGQPAVQFAVMSNPDFYSPGSRLQDLRNPDRVVIGLKSNVGDVLPLQQLYMVFNSKPRSNPRSPSA